MSTKVTDKSDETPRFGIVDFLPSFRQNSFGIHGGFFEAGVQHYVLLLFEATLLKPKYTVHNGL